jgi:hypothetical protein
MRRSSFSKLFSKFDKKGNKSEEGMVEDELRRSIRQRNADEVGRTLSSLSPK